MPCLVPEPLPELIGLLTEQGRGQYLADLAALSKERLIAFFPPDNAGQLALKTTVILNAYETHSEPSKGTRLCLAAVGPTKRADTQEIRIELVELTVLNHAHRWDLAPWYWRTCDFPESHFWGTDAGGTSEANRVAQTSLEYLDSGRIIESLSMYGVTLSQELYHLLGGERINPPACCAHPDAEWTARLVGSLRQSAPWKIPTAVMAEAERLNAWASLKPGRRRRSPSLKILVFPGQTHIRKATLMLTGDRDGQNPRFIIEATGSTARFSDTSWKRPIEVDFLRFGIRPAGRFSDDRVFPPNQVNTSNDVYEAFQIIDGKTT